MESPVRVLIVEDEEMRNLALRIMVGNRFDCHVDQAMTMRQAREYMDQCPDVVLVDIHLPDGDGDDMIDEIRSRCKRTRIVVVTGDDPDSDSVRKALSKNPDDILHKPYTKEELWAACALPADVEV